MSSIATGLSLTFARRDGCCHLYAPEGGANVAAEQALRSVHPRDDFDLTSPAAIGLAKNNVPCICKAINVS
jgi:hypothetical protein